jgi:hypothetical protein
VALGHLHLIVLVYKDGDVLDVSAEGLVAAQDE